MICPRLITSIVVRSPSYCSNGREMFSPSIVTQTKRTSEFLFLVILFVMLTSPTLAYPRKRPPTKLNNITEVTVPRCRPVDPEHLRYRMGKHYDDSRMAMDEEDMKRSSLRERSIEDDDDFENDDEFDDSVDDFDSDIDSISNTMMSDGGYGNSQDRTVRTQESYLDSMKFMRRRRRAAIEEEEYDEDEDDFDEDVTFYQRLMQLNVRHKRAGSRSGRRRKPKKQKLKRKDHLSWKCKMKKIWNKTKPGYFPKYYNSVECLTKLCYYKLNECVEQGYTINLFKMDPNRCNPVPTVGLNTTYEEVWVFEKLHVNVWCECGNPKNKRKRKNRRRRPRDV